MNEVMYGQCSRCGGSLVAGHECPVESGVANARKANYIGAPGCFKLELACQHLTKAFGHYGVYQVGSSLRTKDWRDVDVRYILKDAEFDALFPDAGTMWEQDARWLILTCSISMWLKEQSGLDVDFQFQPQTHANDRHKGARNALGLRIAKRSQSNTGADAK